MKAHSKHANIPRRTTGNFHKNEVSILGTPCGNIKSMAYGLIDRLNGKYKVAYVDADHKGADEGLEMKQSAIGTDATSEYIDKIEFHRFDYRSDLNQFDFKQSMELNDLVIVNGNHFEASRQLIVIDPKKSLEKKLHKLTNVIGIILQKDVNEIPQFLKDHITSFESIPVISADEQDEIHSIVTDIVQNSIPELNGLVLAGGKSMRMQKDKGRLVYHASEQRMHMYQLLNTLTSKAYLSIRSEQGNQFEDDIEVITDAFDGLGPYGAILSAFRSNPDSAWLVTACDQPLLDESTLDLLIQSRNPSKFATAFYNSETEFPEPLVTIWEPRSYPRLLYFLSLGYSCPRKVLINSDIELVKLADESVIKNANTPEEYDQLYGMIHQSIT